MALRRVRAVLHELHSVVFDRLDREDANALVDFFSIPKPTRRGNEGEIRPGKPSAPPDARPHPFRIERKIGASPSCRILPSPPRSFPPDYI
jgi:hypothetical protein